MKHGLSFFFALFLFIGCVQMAASGIAGPATLALSVAIIGFGVIGLVGSIIASQVQRPLLWQIATVAGAVISMPILFVVGYAGAQAAGIVGANREQPQAQLGYHNRPRISRSNEGPPPPPPIRPSGPPPPPPVTSPVRQQSVDQQPANPESTPPAITERGFRGRGGFPQLPDQGGIRGFRGPSVSRGGPGFGSAEPVARPELTPEQAATVEKRKADLNAVIEKAQLTEMVGGPEGNESKKADRNGAPVLGFRYWVVTRRAGQAPEDVFLTFNPIFDRESLEGRLQSSDPKNNSVVARQGYVLGGVQVVADTQVNAMRMIFVRETDGKLDKSDFYMSDWLGTPGEKTPKTLGTGTARVVGICERRQASLRALGLLLSK